MSHEVEIAATSSPEDEDVAFAEEPIAAEVSSEEPEADARDVPEPRRGFFARLFGRRRRSEAVGVAPAPPESIVEGSSPVAGQPAEVSASVSAGSAIESLQARFEPEPEAAEPLEPVSEDAEEKPAIDLAAELKAAEEVAVEEVTALLTSVLDRLGAAHHRPFSRA
jgi:hypothetical protein